VHINANIMGIGILSTIYLAILFSTVLVGCYTSERLAGDHVSNFVAEVISIRDTNYSIPKEAKFVAMSGNDNTGDGSQRSPWRTIGKAVASTAAGGTIVIREGNYHETITISGKALTIQSYPHEKVWLKGSEVITGWVADGNRWRKDGFTFISNHAAPDGYPASSWPFPDMVFINGIPLTQVSKLEAVAIDKFYIEQAKDRLYIGSDPRGKTVEAATLSQALSIVSASGTVVRGLGFMHYATHYNENGTVRCDSSKVTFENNTIVLNGSTGLKVTGADCAVRGNTLAYNGHLGFNGYRADRLLLENNILSYNNQKLYQLSWSAGGAKFARSGDMSIRDNLSEQNIGKGLWFDISSYNNSIVGNTVRDNLVPPGSSVKNAHGIFYELCAGGIIASNNVYGNEGVGIYLADSGQSNAQKLKIYNNTVADNYCDIRVLEGSRGNTNTNELSLGITWNVSGVIVKNNLLINASSILLDCVDQTASKSSSQMIEALDHNGYYRSNASATPNIIGWITAAGALTTNYKTVAAFKTANPTYEINSISIDSPVVGTLFSNEVGHDYRLKAESRGLRAGDALPADVAAALGIRAGVAVDIGMLGIPLEDKTIRVK
jgi:parallel beta-helix repeat protein